MLDDMKILGDFVLCKDVTEEVNGNRKMFLVNPTDNRMSSDNLHIFEVVKVPEEKPDERKYLPVSVGDRVISISTGTDIRIKDVEYKLFELKYITAKLEK